MSIKKPALLLVCPLCGTHALIAYPDGTSSESLTSKKQAYGVVNQALSEGKIDICEKVAIGEQIDCWGQDDQGIPTGPILGIVVKISLKSPENHRTFGGGDLPPECLN